MAYTYTAGDGPNAMSSSEPIGTDPVSVLDEAVRQIKAYLKDTTTPGLQGRLTAIDTLITTANNNISGLSGRPYFPTITYSTAAPTGAWTDANGALWIQHEA